ncbi:hypothetical protein [Methylorubrum sp. SB2]|uniref:hypothetical protein n=1 Tax=Methylorubrum subtropicum TaxID=3138812 RepID=UPI00313BC97E
MEKLKNGAGFLTNRNEVSIKFEIAMALDGEKRTEEALKHYSDLLPAVDIDSYYELNIRYEIARLNLKLWLQNKIKDYAPNLRQAASDWRFWLNRDWHKETTKLWGYYHAACAEKELASLGGPEKSLREHRYAENIERFLQIARQAKGIKRYEVRFTSFFLEIFDYEEFPGEPLKCGLAGVLKEFMIR